MSDTKKPATVLHFPTAETPRPIPKRLAFPSLYGLAGAASGLVRDYGRAGAVNALVEMAELVAAGGDPLQHALAHQRIEVEGD